MGPGGRACLSGSGVRRRGALPFVASRESFVDASLAVRKCAPAGGPRRFLGAVDRGGLRSAPVAVADREEGGVSGASAIAVSVRATGGRFGAMDHRDHGSLRFAGVCSRPLMRARPTTADSGSITKSLIRKPLRRSELGSDNVSRASTHCLTPRPRGSAIACRDPRSTSASESDHLPALHPFLRFQAILLRDG